MFKELTEEEEYLQFGKAIAKWAKKEQFKLATLVNGLWRIGPWPKLLLQEKLVTPLILQQHLKKTGLFNKVEQGVYIEKENV